MPICLPTTTPPTSSSTLSLHDALPILLGAAAIAGGELRFAQRRVHLRPVIARGRRLNLRQRFVGAPHLRQRDRKSTRLNSSHRCISYAVFCLKKKKSSMRLERT